MDANSALCGSPLCYAAGNACSQLFVSPNGYAQVIEQALPIAILGCVYIYQLVKTSPAKISYRTWLVFQILTVLIAIPPFILALSRGAIAGFILGGALLAAVYAAASFCSYYKRILLILISIVSVGASFYGITRYQESSYSNIQGSSSILKEVGLSAQSIYADSGQIIGDIPFTISHRPYDNQRLLMWEASYAMWQDHKMTGVGFDRWQYEYEHHYISPEAAERTMPMPHNNLAFFFSATGWIGGSGYLVFTLGTLIYLIYAVYNRPRNVVPAIGLWAFAALTVHGQVDTGITNKFVMHIFSEY